MGDQDDHVFTDRSNLLYVFALMTLQHTVGRQVLYNVQRWAIHISQFKYFIERVHGAENVFAEVLTRWTKGDQADKLQIQNICALAFHHNQITKSSLDIE